MDGLFGQIGRDGIPADLRRILSAPGGVERVAQHIIDGTLAELGTSKYDRNGQRLHSGELRSLAQVLLEWCATEGLPTPTIALRANAHALSLVSPDTGEQLVPKDMREALGLATGVDLQDFMLTAARDALALVFAVAPQGPEIAELSRRVQAGEWVMSARSLAIKSRASVQAHRAREEYRRVVHDFAGWTLLKWGISSKWKRMPVMSDEAIRARVSKVPAEFLLRAIGDYGTQGAPKGSASLLASALATAPARPAK